MHMQHQQQQPPFDLSSSQYILSSQLFTAQNRAPNQLDYVKFDNTLPTNGGVPPILRGSRSPSLSTHQARIVTTSTQTASTLSSSTSSQSFIFSKKPPLLNEGYDKIRMVSPSSSSSIQVQRIVQNLSSTPIAATSNVVKPVATYYTPNLAHQQDIASSSRSGSSYYHIDDSFGKPSSTNTRWYPSYREQQQLINSPPSQIINVPATESLPASPKEMSLSKSKNDLTGAISIKLAQLFNGQEPQQIRGQTNFGEDQKQNFLGDNQKLNSSNGQSSNDAFPKSIGAPSADVFALQVSIKLQQERIAQMEAKNVQLSEELARAHEIKRVTEARVIESETVKEGLRNEIISLKNSVESYQQRESSTDNELYALSHRVTQLEQEGNQLKNENQQMHLELIALHGSQMNVQVISANYESEICHLNLTIKNMAEQHAKEIEELRNAAEPVLQEEKENRLKVLLLAENEYMRSQFDVMSQQLKQQKETIIRNEKKEAKVILQLKEELNQNEVAEELCEEEDGDCNTSIMRMSSSSSTSSTGGLSRRNKPKMHCPYVQVRQGLLFVLEEGFLESRIHSIGYVDKSMFVKRIIEDTNQTILLAYPRGFGKTTNLQMLEFFLQKPVNEFGNYCTNKQELLTRLFVGGDIAFNKMKLQLTQLKIARKYLHEKDSTLAETFASRSVVHVDLQKIRVASETWDYQNSGFSTLPLEQYLKSLREVLAEVFSRFQYLLLSSSTSEQRLFERFQTMTATNDEMVDALRFLTNLLHRKHRMRVFLIIDSYDAGLSVVNGSDHSNAAILGQMIANVQRNINHTIEKVIISGVQAIPQFNQYLESVQVYGQKDQKYRKYFGLREEEIENIVNKMVDSTLPKAHVVRELLLESIVEYYSGYTNNSGGQLCNTYSVLHYLKEVAKLCSTKKMKKSPRQSDYWNDRNAIHLMHSLTHLFARVKNQTLLLEQLDDLMHGNYVTLEVSQEEETTEFIDFRNALEQSGIVSHEFASNQDTSNFTSIVEQLNQEHRQMFRIANKEVRNLYQEVMSKIYQNLEQ